MASCTGAGVRAVVDGGGASALEGRVVLKDGGQPVADAQVSVLGRTGHVPTDSEGRFVLVPTPRAPFEVLVTLPGGRTLAPIRVASLPEDPWVLEVAWQIAESVTVAEPVAPGIEGTPASGLTLLGATDVVEREPTNLAQALENVAGASTVSEGQAAVPALRGLSAGRTLILLDGARVSSERRVGPSATFVDPAVLEAVEVSRGPGALAYGSDAFGGVIQMRTRRAEPGTPFGGRFEGALGAGSPQQRASLTLHARLRARGHPGRGPLPQLRGLAEPRGRGVQLGLERPGLPRALRAPAGRRPALARLAERLRPRHRASAQQLADRALLLPDGGLEPAQSLVGARRRGQRSAGWG